MKLTAERFSEFFEAVYGFGPFPWQERLAKRVFTGEWPRAIALPTAAGKTACIDIAIFSLACGATNAARRIFFVVDRRIVVDQAFDHASALRRKLMEAREGILLEIGNALREIAHPGWQELPAKEKKEIRPLDVYALRGGMYRETAWTQSPIQPTVITSTVDQVGSRLLFRGYGVSDSMKPVHAGLVGNDAIILLDEAHCSRPFDQTMQAVVKYRQWGEGTRHPFHFVSVTATPSVGIPTETAQRADYAHPVLGKRIKASKPAKLVVAEKAKGKNARSELVKVLEKHARELATEAACVGIIVNRVDTARALRNALQGTEGENVVLLTGRMRPLDREELCHGRLKSLLSHAEGTSPPRYVIGTQCLECGADYDFHALVTECASFDALRQRFGRLNRVARRPTAPAVVVIASDQAEDSSDDPVYGESLANTWKWLSTKAIDDIFDFGVSAVEIALEGDVLAALNTPAVDAPVMFPAHLDCWVQTHPMPVPDPDPAIFLHGPASPGQPDVQVVLRNDLGDNRSKWCEIVTLCPPSSSEALTVPISIFRKWIEGVDGPDRSSDVEGERFDEPESDSTFPPRYALRWEGPARSIPINSSREVKPGEVYVIPCSTEASYLGDFLTPIPFDYAEPAFQTSRDKAILRLLDSKVIADADDFAEALTAEIQAKLAENSPDWLRIAVGELENEKRREAEPHPLGGWVITGKRRLRKHDPTYLEDSETDESYRGYEVTLDQHSLGVARHAERFAEACRLPAEIYRIAALFHDAGKLDPRFQAMLRRSSPRTVFGPPLAKSTRPARTREERDLAREVHCYPRGGRHELLSVALMGSLTNDDMVLFLIGTHHGSARPLASPVAENDSRLSPFGKDLFLQNLRADSSSQDISSWNASLLERFWRVVRKLGWWESAYWETVFRLSDHAQSRMEQESADQRSAVSELATVTISHPNCRSADRFSLTLDGLEGSNPLCFLSSLGVAATLDPILTGGVRMSWSVTDAAWRPTIWTTDRLSQEQVSEQIAKQLRLRDSIDGTDLENELAVADKQHMTARKSIKDAVDAIKQRKLRGKEREKAILKEVNPLEAIAAEKRAAWLALLKSASPSPELALGKDPAALREHFRLISSDIANAVLPSTRSCADLMAAFGCDAIADERTDKVRLTSFCFVTGSGHQYFLQTVRELLTQVNSQRIEAALFSSRPHSDAKLSLRWDPIEDRRYAVMWSDPTSSGNEAKTNWALNLLAYRGLQFLPSVPTRNGLSTTGFAIHSGNLDWSWPIWSHPLSVDSVRSLLANESLQSEILNGKAVASLGVNEVFRAARIQVGNPPLHKLNFAPAKSA